MDQALTIGGELSPSPPLSMVVAVHHSTRPTMSMLGDHQVHGGLQQLVRRRKANQPNAKSGIYTMAAATADAGEQNAAVPGRDQGGRKFGGPDKKEDEYDKLKLNTEDSEVEEAGCKKSPGTGGRRRRYRRSHEIGGQTTGSAIRSLEEKRISRETNGMKLRTLHSKDWCGHRLDGSQSST